VSERNALMSDLLPEWFMRLLTRRYGGGICGMRGSIGLRLFGLMEVELRAVGVLPSRPASLPPVHVHSSPRLVPSVCDGRRVFSV
jgi:hypothetical protein